MELMLPWCYYFVPWIGSRGKEECRFGSHFVEVGIYLWHKLLIEGNALPCLRLCLPRPVAVKIKQIMVSPRSRPSLGVLPCIYVRIGRKILSTSEPVRK